MKIRPSELRAIVRTIIKEEIVAAQSTPPPPSAALPQNNALGKFRADVGMVADAANRAKDAMDRADTKEALRWLEKAVGFATSARALLAGADDRREP